MFEGLHFETIEDLKREYRRLVMIHHPDRGGSEAAMKCLNAEYEHLFKRLKSAGGEREKAHDIDDGFREVMYRVASVPGVTVEICGSWVWITGDTKPVREILKEAGLRWASKKKAWYWSPEPKRRRGPGMPMDWIRERYGSSRVQGEELNSLA